MLKGGTANAEGQTAFAYNRTVGQSLILVCFTKLFVSFSSGLVKMHGVFDDCLGGGEDF